MKLPAFLLLSLAGVSLAMVMPDLDPDLSPGLIEPEPDHSQPDDSKPDDSKPDDSEPDDSEPDSPPKDTTKSTFDHCKVNASALRYRTCGGTSCTAVGQYPSGEVLELKWSYTTSVTPEWLQLSNGYFVSGEYCTPA